MTNRIAIGVILALLPTFGQDKLADSIKPKVRAADSSIPPSPWEVFKNFAVEPGKTYSIDSALDFTSAASVAVTLRTSTDSAADLQTLTLYSYWSVPDADHYNPADSKSGRDFLFSNTGAAIFQVHGSQFRVVLRNDSDKVVIIQELIVFPRLR